MSAQREHQENDVRSRVLAKTFLNWPLFTPQSGRSLARPKRELGELEIAGSIPAVLTTAHFKEEKLAGSQDCLESSTHSQGCGVRDLSLPPRGHPADSSIHANKESPMRTSATPKPREQHPLRAKNQRSRHSDDRRLPSPLVLVDSRQWSTKPFVPGSIPGWGTRSQERSLARLRPGGFQARASEARWVRFDS